MKSLAKKLAFTAFLLSLSAAMQTHSAAAVLFSDDFEAGNLSKRVGNASWNASTSVSVATDQAVSGRYAARFTFNGSSSISEDAFAELRFDVGALQQSLWIQYKLFVPSNYVHRNGDGATNNKLIRLWGADYGDVEKVGYSMWARSGMSSVATDWNYNGQGIGPKDGEYSNFITSADLGRWMTIKIFVQAATSSRLGTMKLWKNGQLIIDDSNKINNYWSSNPHAYRYGYLLGWSNTGFTNTTYMYIDDVIFATAESDLGGSVSDTVPPAPTLSPQIQVR